MVRPRQFARKVQVISLRAQHWSFHVLKTQPLWKQSHSGKVQHWRRISICRTSLYPPTRGKSSLRSQKGNEDETVLIVSEIKSLAALFNCNFIFECRAVNHEAHSLVKHSLTLGPGHHIWSRSLWLLLNIDWLYTLKKSNSQLFSQKPKRKNPKLTSSK